MRNVFCGLLAIALISLSYFAIQAQTINGTISGTVVDQQKAAVAGASVIAKNPETGVERTTTTNDEGVFRIPSLPVGNYTVRVEKTGFATTTKDAVQVSVAADTALDLELATGSVEASVEVQCTLNRAKNQNSGERARYRAHASGQ